MGKSTSSSKGSTPKSSGKIVGSIKANPSVPKGHTKLNEKGKLEIKGKKMPKHGDLSEIGDDKYYDEHYAKYDPREETPSHIKNWLDIKIKRNKK